MSLLTTHFQHCTESPCQYNKTKKEKKKKKRYVDRKERHKRSLFIDNMIVCVENLKKLTKKLLERISDYSKVAGYEVTIQKPKAFLYTNNVQGEFETKTIILFILTPTKIKY